MTTTTAMPPTQDLTREQLFSKAACMTLSIHKVGFSRKTKVAIKSKADQTLVKRTKWIIDCPEYRAITRLDDRVKRDCEKFKLPATIGRGMMLIAAKDLMEVYRILDEYQMQRHTLIDTFCSVYLERKVEAKDRLKDLYVETEYPTLAEVRDKFRVDIQFLTFDLPGFLQNVDRTLAQREREKMAELFKGYGEEIRGGLRDMLQGLVDHLLGALSSESDGHPKTLRAAALTNLTEFLTTFDRRNVTDDSELDKVVTQLRNTLAGITPKGLKKDLQYQEIIRTSLQSVRAQLTSLVVPQATRRILTSQDDL
ncbi:MAG: hypothetical protein H8K04_19820 (plasmid) [Nitrospira sp.]